MKIPSLLLAAWIGACASALPARQVAVAPDGGGTVVGTFDSRAVTIAYVRSRPFLEYQLGVQTDLNRVLKRAHEAGDKALEQDVQALGPAISKRIHAMGFGTAAPEEALARIADRLPAIAEEAGVDMIVSTWDVVHRREGTSTVDVTERLAAAFDPDEETWKVIREIVRTVPDPAEHRD